MSTERPEIIICKGNLCENCNKCEIHCMCTDITLLKEFKAIARGGKS